jgi:hypothetical protein
MLPTCCPLHTPPCLHGPSVNKVLKENMGAANTTPPCPPPAPPTSPPAPVGSGWSPRGSWPRWDLPGPDEGPAMRGQAPGALPTASAHNQPRREREALRHLAPPGTARLLGRRAHPGARGPAEKDAQTEALLASNSLRPHRGQRRRALRPAGASSAPPRHALPRTPAWPASCEGKCVCVGGGGGGARARPPGRRGGRGVRGGCI